MRKCGFKLRTFLSCNDCGYKVPIRPTEFSPDAIYLLIGDCPYCKSSDTSALLDPKPIFSKETEDADQQ